MDTRPISARNDFSIYDLMPPSINDDRVSAATDVLRRFVRDCHIAGESVAVVPTMGALHQGHLSLVSAANRLCDRTVVTIFVNPAQFAPHEDLDQYPRTLEADLAQLNDYQVDRVFVPSKSTMYPEGFSTYVQPPEVALPLEGEMRPTFFRGVTTIVLKLLNIIPADVAVFGQKDYQQAAVIKAMVQDLNLPTRIDVQPIVREADGLAMSSRNVYLDPDERRRAGSLSQALRDAQREYADGARDVESLQRILAATLTRGGVDKIDYAVIADPTDLTICSEATAEHVALIAAWVGNTRLIDNGFLGQRLDSTD